MADAEPEGKAVGKGRCESAGARVSGDKLLNEGKSAEKAAGEDGEDGADNPEWDEKEERLAGGDPPRADADFWKAGHILGDASREFFGVDGIASGAG